MCWAMDTNVMGPDLLRDFCEPIPAPLDHWTNWKPLYISYTHMGFVYKVIIRILCIVAYAEKQTQAAGTYSNRLVDLQVHPTEVWTVLLQFCLMMQMGQKKIAW